MADPDHCHFVYPEDLDGMAVHIPGCWATVHGDLEACTCQIKGSELDQANSAQASAEEHAERLRESLSWHQRQNSRLHQRNRELRHRIEELKRGDG